MNRDDSGKVLNPINSPDYLAKFAAEDQAAWEKGKADGIKRGIPECQGVSIHMQKAAQAEADAATAAQAAKDEKPAEPKK